MSDYEPPPGSVRHIEPDGDGVGCWVYSSPGHADYATALMLAVEFWNGEAWEPYAA